MIRIAPEVEAALARGLPLVALETTIVAHGMPYPQNVSTALALEAIVREAGAVPATIAVIDGCIRVGLSASELEWLATASDVLKLSRADLSYAVATGQHGATTVAATMICANLAGIGVLATGGIGGVHRGAEMTMDVSADLEELARTPVTVVCAGAKALLDLPKTLEVLETRGVPVVCYRSDEFPAFWSRSSGLRAPLRLDEPDAIARLIVAQRELGLGGGTVVANPIPQADEIPSLEMSEHIEIALAEARCDGIAGKALTPFVLERLMSSTAGRSLDANIALVKHNARLAALIAVALAAG
jgi:pseudouridine-5'-phosphate glycosidase